MTVCRGGQGNVSMNCNNLHFLPLGKSDVPHPPPPSRMKLSASSENNFTPSKVFFLRQGYLQHNTYLIDRSPLGLFRVNETQLSKRQNTTTSTKTATVKKSNWPEANQLAIYKCSWEVEPGTTRNKFWDIRISRQGPNHWTIPETHKS